MLCHLKYFFIYFLFYFFFYSLFMIVDFYNDAPNKKLCFSVLLGNGFSGSLKASLLFWLWKHFLSCTIYLLGQIYENNYSMKYYFFCQKFAFVYEVIWSKTMNIYSKSKWLLELSYNLFQWTTSFFVCFKVFLRTNLELLSTGHYSQKK